jgi:hypothetical protein
VRSGATPTKPPRNAWCHAINERTDSGGVDDLSAAKQAEVLDFVEFLRTRTKDVSPVENGEDELNPEDDPILDAIGSVSHGSLAQNIDEDLYGE